MWNPTGPGKAYWSAWKRVWYRACRACDGRGGWSNGPLWEPCYECDAGDIILCWRDVRNSRRARRRFLRALARRYSKPITRTEV
jgi:hypothetical protein